LIDLPNGIRLSYAEQGELSGLPILLLHGVTDSWRSFAPLLSHLPPSLHAVAVSQRGHGDSYRPTAGYSPDAFAADLAASMDAVGLNKAVIVGHSMSSSIAQCFVLRYPERVLGLMLVGSFFAGWRASPAVVELWENTVSWLTDPIDPDFVRAFQESTVARWLPADFLDCVVRESLKVPAHVWRAVFESFLATDFSAQLGSVTVPTRIVWGDKDVICPLREQVALTAAITGAEFVIYEGCGHAPHWEMPERFAADLAAFAEWSVGLANPPGLTGQAARPGPARSAGGAGQR
jgi:pimeloyl-ACP methyl ester carboxylesterase